MDLNEWAKRWGVPQDAMRELVSIGVSGRMHSPLGMSEAAVQTQVRVAASEQGWRLWRNNVGAVTTAEGSHVRYGLCNESRRQNTMFKSSDLIGIRPVPVTMGMLGQTIGQFVAVEVKRRDWKPGASPREKAQGAFLKLVQSFGGHAFFSTGGIEG